MPFVLQPDAMPGIPAATITTPTNNTRVEDSVVVKGTAQNIGGDYWLWITLYDYNANRHHPREGPIAISSDGQWETTVSFESSGRYDITALAADQNASEILLQYQSASQSRANYPGLSAPVSYTHLRAHETPEHLVCRLLLEKKKKKYKKTQ